MPATEGKIPWSLIEGRVVSGPTHTHAHMHTDTHVCACTHREPPVDTHPIGIRQSLAFSFSSRREEMFLRFPLSDMVMDSTLRKRSELSALPSRKPQGWPTVWQVLDNK